MEEDNHTDRMQRLAMVCQKLNKIRKHLNTDHDTDNINQIISSSSSEACLSYMIDLEHKRDPHSNPNHLTQLISFYTRVFSNMPLGLHCQNESYARMLVRFAELKAIEDVHEAEANFDVARSHCHNFAFVHIAHAEFAHSQGKTKKCMYILDNAIKLGAEPKELLETALQRLQAEENRVFPSDDKENDPLFLNSTAHDDFIISSEIQTDKRKSDGSGSLHLSSIFNLGSELLSSDDQQLNWRSASRCKTLPGRVPNALLSVPEKDGFPCNFDGSPSNSSDGSVIQTLFRQTSGSNISSNLGLLSSKKVAVDDRLASFPTPSVTPESKPLKDQASVVSMTTLLYSHDTKNTLKLDDETYNFEQILNSNSPETCWIYLINLEKRGNPHTDIYLLNKLKDCYSKLFSYLPIRQYSKNPSYARILIRYAELKGINDPDEAEDHFIVARSHCKAFAFVHVAYAQFEASQGNVSKATSILLKAQSLNAKPAELLEVALRNLEAGKKQLVSTMDEQLSIVPQLPARVAANKTVKQLKPASKEDVSVGEWKIPTMKTSPEVHCITPPDSKQFPCALTHSRPLPSKLDQLTPNNYGNPSANSSIFPIVNRDPVVLYSSGIVAQKGGPVQQPSRPLNPLDGFHTQQASITSLSNETIMIKSKRFFILKMIGRGGSSKVYQVLDEKKQLFAVKYVNLEEADAQTAESYKNEIEHLNHLQQYSDQIIKLYDYEITNNYIYMVMECGNLDLNTWLRNRMTVNPLERKFYWKNMLEAVHTIHKHGIVHSDLKPANFVIVNASLKLIDFGIANRIQPDVTSIMKDSQVGTLNYMPPEAIKDTSSQHGKGCSKISPKGDVWSLGCILYCMTYRKTPFQSITNQIAKLHAIIDSCHKIEFPDISEKDLLDVLKRCLVRNPRERISIVELLEHPYLQLKAPGSPEPGTNPERPCNSDLKKILTDLAALQSPNTIVRAANNLAKMCNSGRKLDVAECAKST
ncbi:dual specificity protein kinase Ttk isoform X2 [Syngnathoides biaculeatus]|uniref:dual specificity protein kinase Ttk isoform X2 n=1 Tax=Syngnathoides biaculeatus TaxID=300417 RepID=UPI002ADD400E|nr:dual specificity protein kinase Ttk isoform X2 [Syngnathoides biaculeatus]